MRSYRCNDIANVARQLAYLLLSTTDRLRSCSSKFVATMIEIEFEIVACGNGYVYADVCSVLH